MDPDPDPAIFVIDLQDAIKKIILKISFSAYYLLFEGTFIKSQKVVSLTIFFMMEGPGIRTRKHKTNTYPTDPDPQH